jgi:hypothetical protein
MNVEAIKAAIEELPKADRRKLAEWFEELEEQAWDEQIEEDFSPGRTRCAVAGRAATGTCRGRDPADGGGLCRTSQTPPVKVESRTFKRFWKYYDQLPEEIRRQTDKQYALL